MLSSGVVKNSMVPCYLTADKWQEIRRYHPMPNMLPMHVLSMETGVASSYDISRLNPSLLCLQRHCRVSHPAWNSDGTVLAYVTAGTIENPDDTGQNRNIYAFDQVTTSVEPVVVSPVDDAEPTWSPANPNQLAFTRTEGNYQQIWLTTYSDEGVPTERQLTQKGGSHPVWIPPEGRWILYENNGQLWQIDTQNPETTEAPLRSNGQVVFGHEPATSSQ